MKTTVSLISHVIQVPADYSGGRIDQFLSSHFSNYSRTYIQNLIDNQLVTVNNSSVKKPSMLVKAGDTITVSIPESVAIPATKPVPPGLAVEVLYEHEQFLVIAKPPALMVHAPAHASDTFTLVDWLLAHFQEIKTVGFVDRPGIVHRLDKDTSGILLVARNNIAHAQLSALFKNRSIAKTYIALVHGQPPAEGTIAANIDRHAAHKHKMATTVLKGREAITHYKVLEYFKDAALVEFRPITGRTHQIRVHAASIGHPIIGDVLYGTASKLIKRQALHAHKLSFTFLGKEFSFTSALPADMQQLIEQLRKEQK